MPRQAGHTQDNCPTPSQDDADNWAATVAAHKDRTRARILQTAAALLTERGAAGLAMTTLARRAGVARATLYNYFADAERVLEALVDAEVTAFLHDLDQQLSRTTGPDEQLRATVDALVAWVARQAGQRPSRTRNPGPAGSTRAIDIAGIHRPLAAIEDRITQVATTARDAGVLPAGRDPALTARFALALVFGIRGRLAGPGSDQTAAALREFLLAGFGAATADEGPLNTPQPEYRG